MSGKTRVRTTFGKIVEVGERELVDLQRQGLVARVMRRGATPEADEKAEHDKKEKEAAP